MSASRIGGEISNYNENENENINENENLKMKHSISKPLLNETVKHCIK